MRISVTRFRHADRPRPPFPAYTHSSDRSDTVWFDRVPLAAPARRFEHDDRASGTCSPSEHAARVFACNVCFGDAVEPVVTQCGHLYCWKCLYRWAQAPRTASCAPWCPVCNAQLDLSHVVPIYTRGGALEEDAALASSGDSDLMDDEELAIPPRCVLCRAPREAPCVPPAGLQVRSVGSLSTSRFR